MYVFCGTTDLSSQSVEYICHPPDPEAIESARGRHLRL